MVENNETGQFWVTKIQNIYGKHPCENLLIGSGTYKAKKVNYSHFAKIHVIYLCC